MSNQNTVAGVYGLPKMVVSDTNEHALVVPGPTPPSGVTWGPAYYETSLPSNGPNPYTGFPSPAFPVNSGLCVSVPVDIAGSDFDGHPFRLRLAGVAANPGGGNLTIKLYQVPFASLGVISASGSVTTAGAPGSGDNVLKSGGTALTTPPSTATGFLYEMVVLWDSSSSILQSFVNNGYYTSTATGTLIAAAAGTNVTSISAVSALNFLPSFTFATGNAANAVTLQEFCIDRY